jgi:hypothetical protein
MEEKSIMLHTGAQAIMWTESSPAHQTTEHRSFPAAEDIREIKGWLEQEVDLLRIRNYGDNWDGFESDAPDLKVVDCAISVLHWLRGIEGMKAPSRVALSPSGSVALEWVDDSSFLRVEITEPNEIEWMLAIPGEPTEFMTESLPTPLSSGMVRRQEWKTTPIAPSGSEKDRGQEWQLAPTAVDEPAYVSAH